jgi:precorrin-4/cobalt-precorrin-4 C11-methyltransferase
LPTNPEPTVFFISIGAGYALRDMTVRALETLRSVSLAIYPGDWLGAEFQTLLGGRLLLGRSIDERFLLDHIQRAASSQQTAAILFNGDGSIYSGYPPRFPSQRTLQERIEAMGIRTQVIPGISSFQLLAAATGLELAAPTASARFTVLAPFLFDPAGGQERLLQAAQHQHPLLLMCCSHNIREVGEALCRAYGPHAPVIAGAWLGWPQQQVQTLTADQLRTTIGEWPEALVLAVGFPHAKEGACALAS